MKIRVLHETTYSFAVVVRRSVQYLRLTPRADRGQTVLSWAVSGPASLVPWIDGLGNHGKAVGGFVQNPDLHQTTIR